MNLQLAHKIIDEAEAQPFGFLRVRGRELAHEVHEMAQAGLVREGAAGENPNEAVIAGVTHAGHQFYRAFKNRLPFYLTDLVRARSVKILGRLGNS